MSNLTQLAKDYQRVEMAIQYLESEFQTQPPLGQVAENVGLSEYHFQRLFSRWVGISPKRFMQYLTKEYAKELVRGSDNLLDAAFDTGLSGTGRLHDLFVSCEAVTPGQFKTGGEDLEIAYGIHPSPFGHCLLGVTGRGICWLKFVHGQSESALLADIGAHWPKAVLVRDDRRTGSLIQRVFTFSDTEKPAPLHLHVRGTNFQIRVWEALLKIPLGRAVTYQDIARHIGRPRAYRAVGSALGKNPIPFLIPCHRVIRKFGVFGHYGGGPVRKKAILGWEAAHRQKMSKNLAQQ